MSEYTKNKSTEFNYKLLVLDIDGTLVNKYKLISPKMNRALLKLRERGVKITLATGRLLASTVYLARQLKVDLPVICNDGVQIYDLKKNQEIYFSPLPLDVTREILEILQDYPLHVQLFMRKGKIFCDRAYRYKQLKNYIQRSGLRPLSLWSYLRDFFFIPHYFIKQNDLKNGKLEETPGKITIGGKKEYLAEIRVKLEELFKGELGFTSGVPGWMDIMKKGNSKGKALELLTRSYGLKRSEIIAAGDNYNDLEMLEFAGLGIAMDTGPKELKNVADITVPGSDEDGLAEFLTKVLEKS